MYTLAVEIHGLRQLERLQRDLIADVRRRVIAVVEVQGGAFTLEQGSLWVFRFERAQPDDRKGVLEALEQTTALLSARENELAGWGVVLDYIDAPAPEAAARIQAALLPVYEDDAAWLGEAAHPLLAHHLDVAAEPAPSTKLFRISGTKGGGGEEVGSAIEYARNTRAVDSLLDALVPDELVGRMLLVVGDDPLALRVNARAALEQLAGSSPAVRWLEAEADAEHAYAPLSSIFSSLDVHETPFWLNDAERGSWEERSALIEALLSSGGPVVLPDALATDLLIALEGYLLAYVRRAAEAVVTPVLLCHNVDRWPAQATDALVRTISRLPVPEHRPALMLVGTSSRSLSAAGLSELVARTVRLPRRTASELAELSGAQVNWDRLMRLTRGKAAPVVHYLTCAPHWERLTDGELEDVDDADLAWRVASALDSEVQELLLAACYAAPFVAREQYVDLAVRLGTDRVRVPTTLSRLRLLGLIEDRDDVVPSYPELQSRLEIGLGSAAKTVYERVSRGLVELVETRGIGVCERLVGFLGSFAGGEYVPRLYHQLLTRVMNERRLDEAQRLLYDTTPPRGLSPAARACVQAVAATNRIRLALLQANMQAAERTRAQNDRSVETERCGAVAGDLAVQKARLTFHGGPSKETIALLKRAVMIYQEIDDQAGLARANLDFGLVLLAQEDLLGAREYFLLAARSAASSDDTFERVRAQELSLVCDYVYGNLTRAMSEADELDAEAGRAGMREVQLFAELTRGRVAFELGRYQEAGDIFSRGRSRARLYGMSSPGAVMERWLARSLIYDDRVRRAGAILRDNAANPESCFFLAEAHLKLGEHAQAIAALEEGLSLMPQTPGPVESVAWASGFAALEDRAIGVVGGTQVLTHQMMALHGYVLAESGRIADGVEELHRLTRELRISEIDPYNRTYFYLYSLILPDSGELSVEDGTTVLGKAVRYIQQRTSRMDEYAHKTDYLRRNEWNARLMGHAQSHNLV